MIFVIQNGDISVMKPPWTSCAACATLPPEMKTYLDSRAHARRNSSPGLRLTVGGELRGGVGGAATDATPTLPSQGSESA